MDGVITVTGLTKVYGEVRAVDGVDLTIGQGEFFGILGPNGAGKTTTLELVEGLREPDAGEVSLLGQRPWPRNQALLPRIGVQLQASAFFERLTAREQIRTFAALYGVPAARAEAMLERVGLADKAGTRTEKLSGGQLQRLSLACTLVHGPEVVFLDEPTAALDPQARRNLWDLLRTLTEEGRTVVLTTHYMDEAEELCDRVAIMDHGRVLAVDSPAALVRGLHADVRISVLRRSFRGSDPASLPGLSGCEVDGDSVVLTSPEPTAVLTALADRDALEGLQVRGATLEDVFLTLTGREYRA
ncbi:MAG: ABC transporter ATP-binding protein [Nocardioidaceae bacterium]